ncbi:hypothetical protein TNCV_1011341 [Trichonephila clavipes]|uniref:Uncharacterized protein n=1 Tax=Trichonephila clavipes TaxID=2585209 RepID=A0A8X6VXA5_TRICX|nr:hypothetical protein TNCV_1011341 [Trichonephila clavipes]
MPERSCARVLMDPLLLCPGKGLVLPNHNIDQIATHTRFLLISLPNNDMSKISPFAFHKTLIRIGGDPKSVKRFRSGDLLIEITEPSDTSKISKSVKQQNSKNRGKRTKVQKPEIEKMAPHKPRKSAPTEYTTDDTDMLMHYVEEELEPDPTDKFAIKECFRNNPDKNIRALTPTRFRKSRS